MEMHKLITNNRVLHLFATAILPSVVVISLLDAVENIVVASVLSDKVSFKTSSDPLFGAGSKPSK